MLRASGLRYATCREVHVAQRRGKVGCGREVVRDSKLRRIAAETRLVATNKMESGGVRGREADEDREEFI